MTIDKKYVSHSHGLTQPPGEWVNQALCAQTDPELFFNDGNQFAYATAVQICSGCPVINDCLDYAINNRIDDGVWGGLTPTQRRAFARAS